MSNERNFFKSKEWLTHKNMIVILLKLYMFLANLVVFWGYGSSGVQKAKHTLHREENLRGFLKLCSGEGPVLEALCGAFHILRACPGFPRSLGLCPVPLDWVLFLQKDFWLNKVADELTFSGSHHPLLASTNFLKMSSFTLGTEKA